MFTQSVIATLLSWFGIVGGALTVLGNLQTALSLSDWAKWLGSHWQEWVMTVVGGHLGLSHVTTNKAHLLVDVPLIFCLGLIAIASRFSRSWDTDVPVRRKVYSLLAGSALLATWYVAMVYLAGRGVDIDLMAFLIVYWLVAFLMLSHWPYKLALLSASAIVILVTLLLIANNGLTNSTNAELAFEVVLLVSLGAVVIFVARASVFTRQIWFVIFLVIVLVAVSELSKLGVSLQAPAA
jgi:hypothetical protein